MRGMQSANRFRPPSTALEVGLGVGLGIGSLGWGLARAWVGRFKHGMLRPVFLVLLALLLVGSSCAGGWAGTTGWWGPQAFWDPPDLTPNRFFNRQ